MTSVPEPAALPLVDAATQAVNLCALVVGAAAEEYMSSVHAAARKTPGGEAVVDITRPVESSYLYFPLRLGVLRGWTTRIHLYGFGNDSHLVPILQRFAPRADGVVVAERPLADVGETTKALAATLARTGQKPAVAIFGGAPLAHRWSSMCDYEAMHVTSGSAADVFPTLKALAAAMLARVRR